MKRFLCAAVLLLGTAATSSAQDIPLSKILVEGEGWKAAAEGLKGVTFLEAQPNGSVEIYQGELTAMLAPNSKIEKSPPRSGQSKTSSMVDAGVVWMKIEPDTKAIVVGHGFGSKRESFIIDGIGKPTCLALWLESPNFGTGQLVIGDASGQYLWTARTGAKDSWLTGVDRYYSLRVKPGEKASGVKAMVFDSGRLLYAATPLGVQVFDPTGRLSGVILPPAKEEMTALTIGGEKADTLFVACGDKIYSRKIQGKAVYTLKKDK